MANPSTHATAYRSKRARVAAAEEPEQLAAAIADRIVAELPERLGIALAADDATRCRERIRLVVLDVLFGIERGEGRDPACSHASKEKGGSLSDRPRIADLVMLPNDESK